MAQGHRVFGRRKDEQLPAAPEAENHLQNRDGARIGPETLRNACRGRRLPGFVNSVFSSSLRAFVAAVVSHSNGVLLTAVLCLV